MPLAVKRAKRWVVSSIARRFAETAQHFIPRDAECLPDAANHVYSRIGRAGLDALHVAPVDFCQARQVVLSQSALRSQAVDIFSEDGARWQTHSRKVRQGARRESGRIVALWSLRESGFRI